MATTTNYTWNLPTVGGDQDTWGNLLNSNWTSLDTLLGGVTNVELQILDGATITTTELNYLSGATSNIQNQINSIVAAAGQVPDTRLISAGSGLTGGGDLSADRTISHADTSSQTSVSNSGNTYIQGVALDGYGHVTSITSGTITIPEGIGESQSWQDVTSSRADNTVYQNTTGKPIMAAVTASNLSSGAANMDVYVGSSAGALVKIQTASGYFSLMTTTFIVPSGHYYKCDSDDNVISIWAELR